MFVIDSVLIITSVILIAEVNNKVSEYLKQVKH
mgnify:FL=1